MEPTRRWQAPDTSLCFVLAHSSGQMVERVHNAVKYGDATYVEVTVSLEPAATALVVTDSGSGMTRSTRFDIGV